MNAIRPNRSGRRSLTARSALSMASATMLMLLVAVSIMTTGCSDDDNCCASAGGDDASGLGGQTYTSRAFVGSQAGELVLVTRGGGSSAAVSTGGMFAQSLEAGPVDGVLTLDNGLRSILSGDYDPDAVDSPTLTAGDNAGITFAGTATPTSFIGTLAAEGISANQVSGSGGQEDAPLIHLLGSWQHETAISADCGSLGTFELTCEGFTRIRKLGLFLRMDVYEACGEEAFECKLSGPALSAGSWSGLQYFEAVSYSETYEGCPVQITGDLDLGVNSTSLDSTTTGALRFSNSACLPANTQCSFTQTMTASRCEYCWPESCSVES